MLNTHQYSKTNFYVLISRKIKFTFFYHVLSSFCTTACINTIMLYYILLKQSLLISVLKTTLRILVKYLIF